MQTELPLTPALSRRERENCRQPACESSGAAIFQDRPLLFPLLGERARVRGSFN
jgi:hypothetical protein